MEHNYSYRKNLCLDIAALERGRVGQGQYKFNGIDIWPVLRTDLCRSVEEPVLAQGRVFPSLQPALNQFQQCLEGAEGISHTDYLPRSIQDLPSPDSARQRLLFHTRAMRHQVLASGESVCGQIDYLYHLLAPAFDCIKLEQLTWRAKNLHPRYVEPYYFDLPFEDGFTETVNALSGDWCWPEKEFALENYKTMFGAMGVVKSIPKFSGLQSRLALMHAYAHIFDAMLRQANPKAIFTELYYNPEVWGLLLAAKRLGIPTIEVQHGLVGRYQWIMTHWSSIPEGGFDLLPDYFWCFDEETAENLADANNGSSSFRPIVGGIARLLHWSKQETKTQKDDYKQYLSDLGNEEFAILVALNYKDYAPENILFAIENSPKSWRWLIRLHPMSIPAQEVIERRYRAQGLENVEFHYATRIPVYDLMGAVDHLVTGYSTLATEALPFGIGVTLTDQIGAELYPQFIADGRMAAGVTGDALVSILKASASSSSDVTTGEPVVDLKDYSVEAIGRMFDDFRQQAESVETRKKRLDATLLFQNNPIAQVIEKSKSLSRGFKNQEQEIVTPSASVKDALPLREKMFCDGAKDSRRERNDTIDGVSIRPIVHVGLVGEPTSSETPARVLEYSIEPHLRRFKEHIFAEVSAGRLSKHMSSDLVFHDLEQERVAEVWSDENEPCLSFVSRVDQYRHIDGLQARCSVDALIDDLSLTFNVVKSEIYNKKSIESQPRKLPSKFIRTPWGGDVDDFKKSYANQFSQCSEGDVVSILKYSELRQGDEFIARRSGQAVFDVALSSAYARFFELTIKTEQPRAVFIDNVDTPENWGATLAAKNARVPVVQIMPTKLSKCLDLASSWRKHVGDADGFLPDYYWCTAECEDGAVNDIDSFLNYIVCADADGSSRVINQPKGLYAPCLTPEGVSYRKFIQGADRSIIVALADDCSVPQSLLEVMRMSPQQWLWLIRTPRSALSGSDIIARQFYKAGIGNFEIQFASRSSLPELVSQADAFVAIEGSIECELAAAGIDHLLLGAKGDYSPDMIEALLAQNIELSSSPNKRPFTALPVDAVGAVLSDWSERRASHASEGARFASFFENLPTVQEAWRRHYMEHNVRTSKFSLTPQASAASPSRGLQKQPAEKKSEQQLTPLHTQLHRGSLKPVVEHFGSRHSLKIAARLAVWSLRLKILPRRRFLNAYIKAKNTALNLREAVIRNSDELNPPASGKEILEVGRPEALTTLVVVTDLASVDSDQALFSLIYDVDRVKRNGHYAQCQLMVLYDEQCDAGAKNWSVYSRITPVFSSLIPYFTSVQIIPDHLYFLRSSDVKISIASYRWDGHKSQKMLASESILPTLLHDQCRPIVADEESKRYIRQWRKRVCGDKAIATISLSDEMEDISDGLIKLLSSTIKLFQNNDVEVVVLPSPGLDLDYLTARMAGAKLLYECRYNVQLRTAMHELADQNILIGGGINALAGLNGNTRWCYLYSNSSFYGGARLENGDNVVFETMPTPEELLGLIKGTG